MQVHQHLSLLFYRKKKKADKQGYIPIYSRVTITGVGDDEMSTGCKVLFDQWDDAHKVVLPAHHQCKAINKKIGQIRTDLQRHFDLVLAKNGCATPAQVITSYKTPVSQAGNGADPLTMLNIKAPKNGYAYVYVSNESDEHVYFDNLQVTHNRGHILEENHYYAYGLKIAAISSRKLQDVSEGLVRNNYLYNDKEIFEDADLNWYDYGFRMYDPQIGRFPQLDPLAFEFTYYTPFQYAGCEPIANVDLDGLEPLNTVTAPGQMLANVTVTSTRTAVTAVKAAGSVASVATNISMNVALNLTTIYSNARGHTFHIPYTLSTPATLDYLGESWSKTSMSFGSYYTSETIPYNGPTATPGKPREVSWLGRQYKYFTSAEGFAENPIAGIFFSAVNDIYVGGSMLLSAHTGVSRSDIIDLAGYPTTFDQRYMADIGTLTTVFSMGGGSATSTATKGRYSTIYRAVSQAEVDDIAQFGLRMKAGGHETGKLFAPTLQEATQFGKYNFGLDEIPNTIMKVRVPNSVLNGATKFGADGMNAISIPANQLHLLKAKPLNYSPWLR